jgi:hypothetical protein
MIPYRLTIWLTCRVTKKTSDIAASGRGFLLAPPRALYYTTRAIGFLLHPTSGS